MDTARTILLVDDDPTLSTVLAAVLRSGGYTVLTAASGAEALELLRSQSVSVVISDLHMPKMDGVALIAQITLNQLTANARPIPAVLITGSGEFEDIHANAPGVDAILIKPIVRDTLLRTLERLLASVQDKDIA